MATGKASSENQDLLGLIAERVEKLYKVVVEGNGEPPLRETVRQHSRWIDGVNKVVWLVVSVVVAQAIIFFCSVFGATVLLLSQLGKLP